MPPPRHYLQAPITEAILDIRVELPNGTTVADDDNGIPYMPVPPNRTFYVKTRYVFVGRGLPLPFDLEDE